MPSPSSPLTAAQAPCLVHTHHFGYHKDVLNNTAAIFIPVNAVFSVYFDIARKFLTSSWWLLSCFSLEAYNLGLTRTFHTTTAIPYSDTVSFAFVFSAISCSSALHCYTICWHLNFLTAILPLQELNAEVRDKAQAEHCNNHIHSLSPLQITHTKFLIWSPHA